MVRRMMTFAVVNGMNRGSSCVCGFVTGLIEIYGFVNGDSHEDGGTFSFVVVCDVYFLHRLRDNGAQDIAVQDEHQRGQNHTLWKPLPW